MSQSIAQILEKLDDVAEYDGDWTLLRDEIPLLKKRLAELRERESRLDDVLVVALVGGSGVGKSTLLNALAGDELAKTSEYRPCTSVPTIYHPPGARLPLNSEWKRVAGSALEHLVIVDTPDSDTIVKEHRAIVVEVLRKCDLVFMCADSEKYLDEATWSLLRPLGAERAVVCVETKADGAPSVREHWLNRLQEHGIAEAGYFRVNSRRTFDRKVAGQAVGDEEYDFSKLEQFLFKELTTERIQRIKRSNAAGLLTKTIDTLHERVSRRSETLKELEKAFAETNVVVAKESFGIVSERLFAESHLWTYALGREMSVRAKGFVGSVFRLLEVMRTLPTRMAGWSLFSSRDSSGQRAASILTDKGLVSEGLNLTSSGLQGRYKTAQSELGLAMARAGFQAGESNDSYDAFLGELNGHLAEVLRGPARDRIIAKARILTGWPFAILSDIPPLIFVGVSGYNIVTEYFVGEIYDAGFFVHAGTVLAIILAIELFCVSALVRFFAWSSRRAALGDLRVAIVGRQMAFAPEREVLEDAERIAKEIDVLHAEMVGHEA